MIVLNIPGWKNSRERHWQTIWEADNPPLFQRIQQQDWMYPKKDAWILAIKKAIDSYPNVPVYLTAHSIGCMAFIHAVNECQLRVNGALLVAPSDPEQPNYPKEITGFAPVPLSRLSFPSIVVASTDDPAVSLERAKFFADHWGSRFVRLENAGHIDPKNDFGQWPEGRTWLKELFL